MTQTIIALLFAGAAFANGTAEPTALLPVALRAEALVPGTRIHLADLVAPADAARLPGEIAATDLGRAPSPGFGRRFTAAEVASYVAVPLAFTGAEEVVVTSDLVDVTGRELVDAAQALLAAQPGLDPAAIVEAPHLPHDVRVPRGRESRELRATVRHGGGLRGAVATAVEVLVDGKLQLVVPVTLLVRTFGEIAVLARPLERGEELSRAHLAFERLETTALAVVPSAEHAEALLGQTARRALREGAPLRADDFEPATLVRRNDAVTLVFARGGLRAESFGVARDAGRLGDTVRVESVTTKKVLVGRVAGPGLVSMDP